MRGLLVAGGTLLGPPEYRSLAVAIFGPIVAACLWCSHQARKHRDVRPWAWREHRLGLLSAAMITPCAVAYMGWERRLGIPREMVGAAALFAVGLGVVLMSIVDRRRWCYLGGGLALMAFGLCFPFLAPTQIVAAAGIVLAVNGLVAAAVQTWQLHQVTRFHDAN